MSLSSVDNAVSFRLYGVSVRSRGPVVALITRKQADRLVKRGAAEEGLDLDGKTTCFRMTGHRPRRASAAGLNAVTLSEFESQQSNTAFSQAEVMAIAGRWFKHGRSRTARMSEAQRAARINRKNGKRLPAEDLVERATNKYEAWNQIGSLLSDVKVVESVSL